MTGNVFVKEQREDKAGSTFDEDVVIEVKGAPMKYVSRGGYKLEKQWNSGRFLLRIKFVWM